MSHTNGQKNMIDFVKKKDSQKNSVLKPNRMTVADFFCGAGGFSEGFRQAGFKVVFGLDFWKPAVDTHELNNLDGDAVQMNILELDTPEKIDAIVPDTDILIGSPPCVAFSGSNRAGKSDKTLGMELIYAYLRIVAHKMSKGKLKYWILENVPNSAKYIKDEYTWEELGLPGKGPSLKIKARDILSAENFGAPQTRTRFFGGKFPIPKRNGKKPPTIQEIFDALGNPQRKENGRVKDPIYGFGIERDKLTDHYYDPRVEESEWKRARRLKEDHGYMGIMSFPEETNRFSRTVMATLSASTREAMIFQSYDKNGKKNGYRLPTIREIATFMSFPVTYQFEAGGQSSKYRLVGNAVCPKMAEALAIAIAKKENLEIPKEFPPLPDVEPSVNLNGTKREKKKPNRRKENAKFSMHVPYTKIRSFRAALTNRDSDFEENNFLWKCYLHQGTGMKAYKNEIEQNKVKLLLSDKRAFSGLKEIFKDINQDYNKFHLAFDSFKKDLEKEFSNLNLNANKLQEEFRENNDNIGPFHYLEVIKLLIDKHFSEKVYYELDLENLETKGKRIIDIDKRWIPVKVAIALYSCNYFVSLIKK